MILSGLIVAELIGATTIENFFIGVAASHAANHLPLLKSVKGFEESAERCYEKSLEEWAKDNETRKALLPQIENFKALQTYAKKTEDNNIISEIVQIWISKLHEDEICRQLVVELKLDEVKEELSLLLKKVSENGDRLQEIIDWISRFKTKGICEFEEQQDYIERYCAEKETYALFMTLAGSDVRQRLSDFVIKAEQGKSVALMSSMQTGKSTELYHLAWEAQQSKHWLPLLFRLSDLPSLTYNDLPEEEKVADLPILLLIDALDEANKDAFCKVVKEIRYYVEKHPKAHVVVSCRSNFVDFLDDQVFAKVELQPLTWSEAMAYIRKKLPTQAHLLINDIASNDLFDVATIPLTLNVMIKQYSNTGKLSTSRSALYELIIKESINVQNAKKLTLLTISEEDELKILERVAGTMIVMGKRELSEAEFDKIIDGETQLEQLRYDVLQKTKSGTVTVIKFKSNAVLEYLAARLLTRCKGMEELKSLTYYEGGGKINPWWEQPLRLWTEMVENAVPNMKKAAAEWLTKEAPDIAVFAPNTLIDDNERGNIVVNLMEAYRKEDRPLYVFGNDLSQKRLRMPRNVITYLTGEWGKATTVSCHLKNLQMITRLLDWDYLLQLYPQEMNDLKDTLYDILKHPLFKGEHSEYVYLAMANEHFFIGTEVKRLFGQIGSRTSKHDVEVMVSRISLLDDVNPYADYLVKAETLLRRDRTNNDYQIIVREPLYNAIGKLSEESAVEKALTLMSGREYWRYADKREHGDDGYQKVMQRAQAIIDADDSKASLKEAMTKACQQREQWIVKPLPTPTAEQVAQTVKHISDEVDVMCNFIKFRGQARSILTNYSDETGRVNWQKIYEDELNSTERKSPYVIEFLIRYGADDKAFFINEQKARKALNDEDLYKNYRMEALYDFINGRRIGYELSPKQEQICMANAENILKRMLGKPHAGSFTKGEQIVIELLLKGKIDIAASVENYKALLHYIHVPVNTSIDDLYSESTPSLFRYVEKQIPSQDFQELLYDMIEHPTTEMDMPICNTILHYLVKIHHQKTLTMLLGVVKLGNHPMSSQWIFDLVEEGSLTDVMIAAADEVVGALKKFERVSQGKVNFVFELCDALMSKPDRHAWVKETLVALYARYELPHMRQRLNMLFRLGSDEALRLVLSNPILLKDTDNYEFRYDQESSVMLLSRMYCLCRDKQIFVPVLNTILESLCKIATKSKAALELVKNTAITEIRDFGVEGRMNVERWTKLLDEMYLMEHQPQRDVLAAQQFILGLVA